MRNRIKQELADAAFQNTQEPGEYKIAIHHTILTGPEDSLSVLLNEGRLDEETAQKQAAPTMLVNVIIEQNGYQLKPDVHLERAQDGLWYVTWLEGLDVDPRWFDQQDAAKVPAEEMRKVSEELHDALQQKADANNDPAP